MHKIENGNEQVDLNLVTKKTIKSLHSLKILLDKIMDSYKDLNQLFLNDFGVTVVEDNFTFSLGENNEIELKDLKRVCNIWLEKKKPEYPDKTDYSPLIQKQG